MSIPVEEATLAPSKQAGEERRERDGALTANCFKKPFTAFHNDTCPITARAKHLSSRCDAYNEPQEQNGGG